ncbi:MAG: acyltransferase [Phycisphaeraceae bacterium]|nr:acyltransferase [Phycisphaeraceae bacterium]
MNQIAIPSDRIRFEGVDAARVIASLATVWFHAAESLSGRGAGGNRVAQSMLAWAEVTRFAVAFFAMAAAFFLVLSLRRDPSKSYRTFAGGRFRRLYLPFLGWAAIYYLASEVNHRFITHTPSQGLGVSVLWWGTAYHLWFLPFLLACLLVAFPVVKFALASRRREVLVGFAALLLGAVVALWPLHGSVDSQIPQIKDGDILGIHLPVLDVENTVFALGKWWARAPGFLWGIGLGLLWDVRNAMGSRRGKTPLSVGTGLVGVALIGVCVGVLLDQGQMNVYHNLEGVGLFVAALSPLLAVAVGLAKLGRLTYGIYLAHVLVVQVVEVVAQKAGMLNYWWAYPVVFAIAAAGSVVVAKALRWHRWTAWLTP